jgi:hypothetical protein
MSDLEPDELAEIECKVARYRDMITKAAMRRAEKRKNAKPDIAEKRRLRRLLDEPRVQIALLERVLAGASYTDLAAEYMHSPSFLSNILRSAMLDCFDYEEGKDSEWHRCLRANRKEWHETWMPVALQRLKDKS